jgi:sec-independent protein translocase protein TatC
MEGQVNVLFGSVFLPVYFKFSLYFMEIWKFISPALYKNEKKNAKAFIFFSSLLFFIGVLFGYNSHVS